MPRKRHQIVTHENRRMLAIPGLALLFPSLLSSLR